MNFADIENRWRSPQNQPTPAQLEETRMKFAADLRRKQRGSLIFLALVFILLALFTGQAGVSLLWPDPTRDRVDLSREWGIIPLFLLPWMGWGFWVRLHYRHRSRHPDYGRSLHAAVAALLDENRSERMRYRFIAGVLFASVLVVPLIVHQLHAVGKAGGEIIVPALVIYPAYVVGMLGWLAFSYRRKLIPRKLELEKLLAAYE